MRSKKRRGAKPDSAETKGARRPAGQRRDRARQRPSSPPPPHRIRDPKERILSVAEQVFGEKGFAGARTQDIAQRAGVNKAMIHYYFDTKEKLYHAMLDRILFDLIKLTQDETTPEVAPNQLVESYFRAFFQYVARHRYFSRLTPMDLGSGSPYLHNIIVNFFRPLFKRGETFLQQGMATGDFKEHSPRQLLISIYGMTMSYFADAEFIRLLYDEDPTSQTMLEERLEACLDMIFHTLGCERASPSDH